MGQAHEVVPVPLKEGVVEVVGDSVLLEGVRRGRLTQREARRVCRGERHDDEDEQRHAQHHDRQRDQAPSDQADEVGH